MRELLIQSSKWFEQERKAEDIQELDLQKVF
jgi:hypothetical protein